jgi:hypothetical protein
MSHKIKYIISYLSVLKVLAGLCVKSIRLWWVMDISGKFWRFVAHSGIFWQKGQAG